MFFFKRCGSFNPTTGETVIYSGNSTSRQKVDSETDLEYLGVITAISDAVVTDFSIANPKYKGKIQVNKNIVSFSDKSADVCVKIDSLLIRPSDAIERIIRRSAVDLKRHYTRLLNNPTENKSLFREALNTNVQTASTVGVTVRTDDNDKRYTFYNKKASMGFSIFNSHPLSIEAHTDADVMILMAIFLKHNSLWHNKRGLMYDQFDYAKMFFRRDKKTDTPFFAYELASCIPVSEVEDNDNGKKRKRKATIEEGADMSSTNFAAATNLIGLQSASRQCRHSLSFSYIDLYSDDDKQPYCVSCFCSMFFVASGTVQFRDKKGLQEWIDGENERYADRRLVEHLNTLSYVECSSKIEHDYKFWNLINSLDGRRKKPLPAMDTGLLFANMNPFGKMLLVIMQNCFIVTKEGKVEGKWFDLDYIGPNFWKFQIMSYREEKFNTFEDMACVETLRRLPMQGEPIVSRMVFRTYCRGENLSSAYEVVSDVAQTVNNMRMNIEGRKFFFEDSKLCSSAEASDEVLLSLEVTGYRPNRAQNNMNSNRVSARVMRILCSREGARAWKKREADEEDDCILVEDLSPCNENASYKAMERMSNLNKIFYYDIETNTNKCSASNAIITSICGSLCTGGDVDGGERVIFALAASVKPEELVQCIREEYLCQGNMITDYPPEKIYAFSTEYELLFAFSEYMREAKPHIFCGWNSKSFDDPFVFYRMVHHLKHNKDPNKRVALAYTNGLFNFDPFMITREGHRELSEAFYGDSSAAAAAHDNMSYMDHQRQKGQGGGGGIDLNAILGSCCRMVRLDMKEVCAKAYENLAEYNLNAVLVKVSKVGDKMAILKDPIDIAKQLLGYLSLKTAKEQAPVHKYCSKDAYVVGIVDISTNKGGEMRRLCYDSMLIESVVTANMPTPLCISDGAICRSMGKERALKRGCGIRKHSMATETKGGMVSQPIVDSVCLQTVDMSSLYPSTMCQYNLCTSTFVTHMQVINLRDRVAIKYLASHSVLDAVDRANADILDRYRPIDIVVKSWRIDSTDGVKRTQLEKKLNVYWDKTKNDGSHREWCRDKPPSFSITAAGMEYFPEYGCSLDLQRAANVNDDMHINPSDLEYMVPALVAMALEDAGLAAHVTCGTCTTTEGLLAMLDADFDRETDKKIKERLYTYVGTDSDPDWAVDHAFDRIASIVNTVPAHSLNIIDLLDRILRRVNAFDSTNDEVLRKWAARMINVGSFVRAWNMKRNVLNGVIPVLQADYKASRTGMQQKAKMYAAIDPKQAEFNKVGEKTTKLSMNSIYGCLGLRANQSHKSVGASFSSMEGGAGGGTRHSPTANQITSVSRCVFGNISCAIQQALPNAKQVYGDTDSVFCNHNIPGDGGGRSLFVRESDGRLVYRIDTLTKNKIANFLPLFINAVTKGIKFDEERDAGVPFMKIAHERLAFMVFLFAKKTYHMMHLKEGSKGSDAILACKGEEDSSIDKFTRAIDCPEEYKDYVIAHNPTLILAAAANDEKLNEFLIKEGATSRESLKAWFTTSGRWLELDADMLYSMYASRMLDVENCNWIDWKTSRLIERSTQLYEGVTQAAEAFTVYRKGAFVKKGIPSSTKLKGLQSLFIRNLPRKLFDRANEYKNGIEHHVQNCASFEASPFMSITSSRVNKYKAYEKQKLPNPMAMALNNHIHPDNPILPAEKFLTVTVVSAWAISGDKSHGSIPTVYFNNKTVKWDAEMMRGLVPGSVIKSLSMVPNTIRTVMEMVRSDAKNIESVIEECVNTLTTASTGASGFSLKKRALCFNTGILCSDTLVRAVLSGNAAVWRANGYVEETKKDEENNIEEEEAGKKNWAKFSLEKIRERVLNCMFYDDVVFHKNVDPNSLDLKGLMCDKLRVDDRVYEQLCNLVDQLTTSKDMTTKKRVGKESVSVLDEMIAIVEIDFDRVVDICADRMVQHCKKCPVIMPDNKNERLFKKVLDLLAGKIKCTATCVNATCQSLDFVLLCTLALREVNRRRRTGEFDVSPSDYSTGEIVKAAFGPRFNRELDAVVLLFDEPAAPMSKARVDKKIRDGASSLATGEVYNPDDGRFFGGLMDRDWMIEESLLQGGSAVELSFVTGVYYREAMELAVSRLCENQRLRGLLEKV